MGGAEPLLRLHAPQLEELETQRVFIGDDAVARMCADGLLPRESLSLEDAGITSIGAVALAGCPRLANLQILNLNDNPIGADGIAAILTSPHLTQLQELRTSHTDNPREALLPVLFASPPRPTLSLNSWGHAFLLNRSPKDGTQLRVVGPRQGFEWPASGVCPEPLAGLSFEQFGFTPTTWKRLRAWLTGQTLASLTFMDCQLHNDDLPELLKLVEQVRPSEVNLRDNEIGVNGCKALAACPALATVRVLDLTGNPIRLSGAMAIAESENRGKLKTFRAASLGRTLSVAERKKLTAAFKGVKVYL